MRIGSLCSGIGGLERGLEQAGVGTTVWQVEIDPFCRAVLAKHWPDAERFDDVKTVGSHNLSPVDVLCAGFPCQPHSVAGRRSGTSDLRYLWPDIARVVRQLRPGGLRFVVLENTPGILTDGTLGRVLGDLADCGFDAEWAVLSARHAGALHLRERVFLIAYPRSERGERIITHTFHRQPAFSWCEDVRRVEDLRGRSDLPEPLVRRNGDGVSTRLHALGNAVVPQVAEVVGWRLLAIANALEPA